MRRLFIRPTAPRSKSNSPSSTSCSKRPAGGGPKYTERHHKRGKLLARERIELLIDRDSPFLELSSVAAAGTEYHVGGSGVGGIGVVSGVECLITGNDPTVRGGAVNPYSLAKTIRALHDRAAEPLARDFSGRVGRSRSTAQAEIFVPGGAVFRDLTQLSSLGIPTVALVFGNSTAGRRVQPSHVRLLGLRARTGQGVSRWPALVKMATGEESTDEELGGAEMHARVSGLSDYLANDEYDALRLGRQIMANLNWRKSGPAPSTAVAEPLYDAEDLLGLAPSDLKVPADIYEVLARVVDGSQFDEYKPLYGTSLVTGWASIHGFPVGILANARGVLFSEEAQKATQFIQLANRNDVPLVFIQNVTGFMVGKEYEQRGIIKHGAMMINAVSNSTVPHLTLQIGASYGAGNYGMCGRAYNPRFVYIWPNSKTAVMGPQQLAGVMSIVGRAAAAEAGRPFDEAADKMQRAFVENQIESESLATYTSARIYDDGIIDPRDTRTVLGMSLSACHSNEVRGTRQWGVFRM